MEYRNIPRSVVWGLEIHLLDKEDSTYDSGHNLQEATEETTRDDLHQQEAEEDHSQKQNKHDEPPLVSLAQDEGTKSPNTLLDKLNQPIEQHRSNSPPCNRI